jgi:DNA-binding NtrC family response regulator
MRGKIKIFLVEDDEMFLKSAVHQLSRDQSYAVKTFTTGEDALEAIKKTKVDVVVLDYFLDSEVPGAKSGIEILKEIKAHKPTLEVIMLSGQEDVDVALNSMEFGAFDYVVKNKSSMVRVQNDIKRVLQSNEVALSHKNYKMFTKWFFGFLILLVIFLVIYAFDHSVFGLLGDPEILNAGN